VFLAGARLELLCRAHQDVPGGYAFPFEPDRSTLMLFTRHSASRRICCADSLAKPVNWIVETGALAKVRAAGREARPVLFDAV
jgi:hypothetical protein